MKLIESDMVEKVEKNNLHMRTITFNMRPHLLIEMLIQCENTNIYSTGSVNTTFLLSGKGFLTPIDVYILGENSVAVVIYPYDNDVALAKQTHRNYLKEKKACAEFVIKFAKKISSQRQLGD